MDDLGKIPEEVMADKAPDLVSRAHSRSRQLETWGWTNVRRHYRYGPKGTGQARAFITAERGDHRVTAEYLFSLNNRHRPLVKFLGGFWDGGQFTDENSFRELAKPLNSTYTQPRRNNKRQGTGTMATETTTTPRRRTRKAAASAPETTPKAPTRRPRKAAAKPAPEPEPEVEETTTAKQRNAEEVAARRAERQEANDSLMADVVEMREKDKLWDEISDALEISVGRAQLLWFTHEYNEEYGADRPEATASAVKADRDAGLSWGRIQAKYLISRKQAWAFLEEAGVDHFDSDIGRGGRHINRDPEEMEARRAARKPTGAKRGRKPKFKGFDNDTPDEDVADMVEGRKVEWKRNRGDGTETATVKPGSMVHGEDKRGNKTLKFSDGSKSRTIYVKNIVAVS